MTEASPVHERLGVRPTPPPEPLTTVTLWDEAERPTAPGPPAGAVYTAYGRAIAGHLVQVHDHLRAELTQIRDLIGQVRDSETGVAQARSAINQMTLRSNSWTLGAYCASYCRIVTGHHSLEDQAVFPHLRAREPDLGPVIDRLASEHEIIHKVLEDVDAELVELVRNPADFSRLQQAADVLTDVLLSHLAYEEAQLVEPLARHGFYTGQV
jgi:hemerythrin HHE cation binding domain-containing protein